MIRTSMTSWMMRYRSEKAPRIDPSARLLCLKRRVVRRLPL